MHMEQTSLCSVFCGDHKAVKQFPDQAAFIYIIKILSANFFEALNADWQFLSSLQILSPHPILYQSL